MQDPSEVQPTSPEAIDLQRLLQKAADVNVQLWDLIVSCAETAHLSAISLAGVSPGNRPSIIQSSTGSEPQTSLENRES